MESLRNILKKVIPSRLALTLRVMQARLQWSAKLVFLNIFEKNKLKKISGAHLLLNIGCGKAPRAGWINIDINPCKGAYFADVTRGILLKDDTVSRIHCEHLFEHFNYEEAKEFLKECLRILEKGGCLRLIMPDAEKYVRAYCQNDSLFFESLNRLGGGLFRTKLEIINQMFRMGGAHKFAWDFETLSIVLKEVGFTRVEKSQFESAVSKLHIDFTDSWRLIESLYVNVYK